MGNGMTVWVSDYKEYEGKGQANLLTSFTSRFSHSPSSIIFHMAFIKQSTQLRQEFSLFSTEFGIFMNKVPNLGIIDQKRTTFPKSGTYYLAEINSLCEENTCIPQKLSNSNKNFVRML